jgi:hypothetical protein
VVADGESSNSSFEGDSPVTIMARELRRKKRELIEMQSLPQTNFRHTHGRARDLRIEIAELELLVPEERILESLGEERETLIHVLNSMVRSGIRRDAEPRVLLQEHIETLNQKRDTINVERTRRGVLDTRQFPLRGSTRELILIRNQDASDLAPYEDFQGSQTEDGSADDYEFDFGNEPQEMFGDNPQDDYEGESDASSPDSGVFLPSDDRHGQYPYKRMRYERHMANLERFQARLGSIEARLVSLYPGAQGSSFPRQQAPGPVDEDVVMGEANQDSDSTDRIY